MGASRISMEIRRLNTLRAMAALMVLAGHYSNHSKLWDAILGQRAPQLGVMLFFLLSSFLMSVLYMHRDPTPKTLKNYAWARAGRVLPLFVLVVLGSYALVKLPIPWISESVYQIPDLKSLVSHVLLLYGVQVLWTIPTEIHFYFIFGLLWWLRPRAPWVIAAFCAVILVVFSSGHWPLGPKQPFMGFPIDLPLLRGLPYFVVGMSLGILYHRWKSPHQSHWFVATLGLVFLLYPAILERLAGWTYDMWFNPLILLVMGLVFFCVVFLVPQGNRLLENRAGDFLGKISYSLYLLHFPILLVLGKWGLVHGVSGLLLFLAISIVAATASFHFFEAPMRRRIRALGATTPTVT